VGGSLSGAITSRKDRLVVAFTSAGNYQLLGNEDVIIISKSTGAATQVLPPTAGVLIGYSITVKDGKGDAATNNITFVGSVDGVTNPVINTNFGVKTYCWNGAAWNVIG
jgi:hypothetical protein